MTPSRIFNVYKPPGISSYDVIRHFKRNLNIKKLKIGHFGTLDPFAEGVLLIALSRASRLNDYVHNELTKTYIAEGILGVESETGDLTDPISNKDETDYFKEEISQFSKNFIEKKLNEKFLGVYEQAPHKFSAAKFEGKKLYEWAREGVDIKKEKKIRHIYKIEVINYQFPKLTIRFEVSSGTYIRTLFSECANFLGTLGCLEKLYREKVGNIHMDESLKQKDWPMMGSEWDAEKFSIPFHELLPFGKVSLNHKKSSRIKNGMSVTPDKVFQKEKKLCWVFDESSKLLSLGKWIEDEKIHPVINF